MNSILRGLEKAIKGILPSETQSGNTGGDCDAVEIMVRRIEQRINFRDRDSARSIRDLLNFISSTNFALRNDTEIEPRSAMRDKQSRHLWIAHSNSETMAGDTRLRYLKDCSSDFVLGPNANFIVGNFDRKILAKLAVFKVIRLSSRSQ